MFGPILWGIFVEQGVANFFELSPYLIGYLVLGLYLLASFFKLRYVVTDGLLTVKWWGFTWNKVPIADIKSIEKTNSPLSSPAPSFDRILILYGKFNDLIISPEDKYAFGNYLKEINPGIVLKWEDEVKIGD